MSRLDPSVQSVESVIRHCGHDHTRVCFCAHESLTSLIGLVAAMRNH